MQFEFSFQEGNDAEFDELMTLQNSLMNQIRDNLKENINNFFVANSSYCSFSKLYELLKQKSNNELAIIQFNRRFSPEQKFEIKFLLQKLLN